MCNNAAQTDSSSLSYYFNNNTHMDSHLNTKAKPDIQTECFAIHYNTQYNYKHTIHIKTTSTYTSQRVCLYSARKFEILKEGTPDLLSKLTMYILF